MPSGLEGLSIKDDQNVVITYPRGSYILDPLKKAILNNLPSPVIFNSLEEVPKDVDLFHYGEYEDLDHEKLFDGDRYLTNSYTFRKGLIRKHYLANTISYYTAKHPESILKTAFPETFLLECPYAEFLDDALDESYELRCELVENERKMALKKTYILKPSMSDKGQGIRLFKTIDQLQDIFNSFDDESGDESESEGLENAIILSQMRHFVIQEYLADPLLLPEYGNRKFHIRTYVLCSGNLKVYVYQRMLMLFSEYPYVSPTLNGAIDMVGHLTNTCLQEDTEETVVVEFEKSVLSDKLKQKILGQINEAVSELFKAALTVDRINFQPLPNAFETYGLDFLVDFHGDVQILEVNAYPDFKQTGDDLKGLIYELFDGVLAKAVAPFFSCAEGKAENMYKVFEKDDLFV